MEYIFINTSIKDLNIPGAQPTIDLTETIAQFIPVCANVVGPETIQFDFVMATELDKHKLIFLNSLNLGLIDSKTQEKLKRFFENPAPINYGGLMKLFIVLSRNYQQHSFADYVKIKYPNH